MILPKELTTVTPLSKALALIMFIVLPITGFFLGMKYQSFKYKSHRTEIFQNATPTPSLFPTIINQDETGDWETYYNKTFKMSLKYPPTWFGPEVYETSGEFFLEVGTDKVYPYGADITAKTYTKNNSYFISVLFRKKPDNQTIEQYKTSQPWLNSYLPLFTIDDGESISDQRSKLIRVKEIMIENYKGVEFISTLSDTAQTQMVYTRSVLLINNSYDLIEVTGRPNNVDSTASTDWKTAYKLVDESNLETFRNFINSIRFL